MVSPHLQPNMQPTISSKQHQNVDKDIQLSTQVTKIRVQGKHKTTKTFKFCMKSCSYSLSLTLLQWIWPFIVNMKCRSGRIIFVLVSWRHSSSFNSTAVTFCSEMRNLWGVCAQILPCLYFLKLVAQYTAALTIAISEWPLTTFGLDSKGEDSLSK